MLQAASMTAVSSLLEKLSNRSITAVEAGALLLDHLSGGRLDSQKFLEDPFSLTGPPYYISRYLAQITLKALKGEYESTEEMMDSLESLFDRNAPTLERGQSRGADRVVIPEAKVIELRYPERKREGEWESAITAHVTSGTLRGREIHIRLSSNESRTSCFLVPYLWTHAAFAAYNLAPCDGDVFQARPETFIVIEPMRQVNATSVARSLHCAKPQLDQIRRGKGDVTAQTLKGTIVHAMFDRLLEGETDLQAMYDAVAPRYMVHLAAVADACFDEDGFRTEVLRHVTALRRFLEANPNLLKDAQLELKRYSATIGIQGRIDALFHQNGRMDILELKMGARIHPEDHAQLFIYRLLLSDLLRRLQRSRGKEIGVSARILSSTDGAFAPLHIQTDFHQVLDARNKLLAIQYALGRNAPHFKFRYEGFNENVCAACPPWRRKKCKESSDLFGDRPSSNASPELEYFKNFTRLVERERWLADRELADLLDDSRTEMRKRAFRTLVNVRIAAEAPPFSFEFDENTSDLEPGDAVLIHSGNISGAPAFHGYVRDIDSRRLHVSIPIKNLTPNAFLGQPWIIDRVPSDITAEASHTALYDFLVSPADEIKRAVLGISDFGFRIADLKDAKSEIRNPKSEIFNDSQSAAIDRSVYCPVFHLIWGPPGTGKTRIIPEIVRRVGGPVLLGAFTNTAVDKMLLALIDDDPSVRFVRMGRASESPELAARLEDPSNYFSEDLALKHRSVHALRRALDAAPIVASTAHRACASPYLRRRTFDMTIVDEAGQLTEPLTLGLILRGRRFVLIGDDRQLPPVVRTRALAESMFERLKRGEEAERRGALTLLDIQYRMHPEIMSLSNRLFYDGRLRAGVSEEDRRSPRGRPVTFIPVEDEPDGRKNEGEAEVVARLVRCYRTEYGIPASAIGVVSPFRAQAALLRRRIEDPGVTIDTVERFQGGERDIMILSCVRSREAGFVFDERRFNVAITRARRKLVFVANPDLFRNSRYAWISTFIETPRTAGAI